MASRPFSMQGQYNMRSPAVKRLMMEAKELSEATEQFAAHPLEDNLFEWHFTIRGPQDSDFEGGVYHGRIILPPEYPMKPPSIVLLTANGRFEVNRKICLSISGHHPETWQPSWSIRTAMLAIIGFMPTPGGGAIGSLDYTGAERKELARRSRSFTCPCCGSIRSLVLPVTEASSQTVREAQALGSQLQMVVKETKKDTQSSAADRPLTPATSVSPSDGAGTTGAATPPPPPYSATSDVTPSHSSAAAGRPLSTLTGGQGETTTGDSANLSPGGTGDVSSASLPRVVPSPPSSLSSPTPATSSEGTSATLGSGAPPQAPPVGRGDNLENPANVAGGVSQPEIPTNREGVGARPVAVPTSRSATGFTQLVDSTSLFLMVLFVAIFVGLFLRRVLSSRLIGSWFGY